MIDYQESPQTEKLETQQRQMTDLLALLFRQGQRTSEVRFTIFHKS